MMTVWAGRLTPHARVAVQQRTLIGEVSHSEFQCYLKIYLNESLREKLFSQVPVGPQHASMMDTKTLFFLQFNLLSLLLGEKK